MTRSAAKMGRVREVALVPQEDPIRIAALIVRTSDGDRIVATELLRHGERRGANLGALADLPKYSSGEGMLLLERDLLDQQIIDVHGRKVVRVNDIELALDARHAPSSAIGLRIAFVDAGARGRGPAVAQGRAAAPCAGQLAGADSCAQHSVGVRQPDRDRPGAAGAAEDFLRARLASAPRRHRRHHRRAGAGRARCRLPGAG